LKNPVWIILIHKHTNFIAIVCIILDMDMDASINTPTSLSHHITSPILKPHVDVKPHIAPQVREPLWNGNHVHILQLSTLFITL